MPVAMPTAKGCFTLSILRRPPRLDQIPGIFVLHLPRGTLDFVPPFQLFRGNVPNAFAPTAWMLVTDARIPLAFNLVTTGGPTAFNFYPEFTDDPTAAAAALLASREVDEQDVGNGVVTMSKVIRTFQENNGALLQNGTHNLSTQFVRMAPFMRLQIQTSAGSAVALITSSFGSAPIAP